jgi:branched-chain amino acid transport system permease protein
LGDLLLAELVNGIATGCIYFLVAFGLALIYGVLRRLHFAHGEVYMFGSYFALFAMSVLHLPYFVSFVAAILGAAVLGVLIERLVFRPLAGAPQLNSFVAALGSSVFLQYLALAAFTGDYRDLPSPLADMKRSLGVVYITDQRLLIIAIAITLAIAGHMVLRRTHYGRLVRAITQESVAASSLGINVEAVALATFAIGSGVAGLAGALIAPITLISPFMGTGLILKAFVVILLAGYENLVATLAAALLLGLLESYATAFFSVTFQDLVSFTVVVVLLLIRPAGLGGAARGAAHSG